MEVILAGYNIDGELLAEFRARCTQPGTASAGAPRSAGAQTAGDVASPPPTPDPDALTPETLSAAYARISRDPRPIPELRRESRRDVPNARRSNRRIVFGYGHASVAEHAVFNFDILGLSRLAVEALEAGRLGSYTEKSQRYILLERDYVVPAEIAGGSLDPEFRALLELQQEGYRRAFEAIARHHAATRADEWEDPKKRKLLEGEAKEDARYFLGLATTGQLGMTLNARTLEATIRRLCAHPLEEARELGRRLHGAIAEVAPSLVRYTDPPPCRREAPRTIRERVVVLRSELADGAGAHAQAGPRNSPAQEATPPREDLPLHGVRLLHASAEGEARLLTAVIHNHSGLSWTDAEALAARLGDEERRQLIGECLRHLTVHDAPLREFELPEFTFELVVSASCFAQLKRHRIATQLPQNYDPSLGVTAPSVFGPTNLRDAFAKVRTHSEELYAKISASVAEPEVAAYALTNAHRRRVLFKANARELYHFSRLRMDAHAQWDIRALANEMIRQARERMPLVMMLAAGKDCFDEARAAELGGCFD